MSVRLSPSWPASARTRSCASSEARARLRAAASRSSTSAWASRARRRPRSSARRWSAAITPLAPYPSAVGLPELRAAIAGWAGRRFGAALDPDTEVIPTLGSKEAVFALANVFDGEAVAVRTPAYPVYERGAAFAGKRVSSCRCARRTAGCPTSTRVDWSRRRRAVAQLPEQPDRRPRAARVLRARRRAGARARLRARLRRGLLGALLRRRAAGLRAAGRRPHDVAVFNTLSKRSSMPGYRSGFVAGDPEIVAALKQYRPERRRRAAGVRPARGDRRLGRRAPRREVRERYRAKRDVAAARAGGARPARGGRRRHVLSVDGGRLRRELAARWLEAGVVVAPGSFFGPTARLSGYARAAGAACPPPERRAPAGRPSDRQSFACSAALSPAQLPERGSASTVPVVELRRNSRPLAPLSSRALDHLAVGQRDQRAGGDVEARLDRAVVAEPDADAGVGAEQAALADADDLVAAAATACP